MCGIAGIVGLPRAQGEPLVRRALALLAHRGPDGEGILAADEVVLGMRRLAIIDLAHGEQPIFNEDRSVAAVCNGELYRYVEGFRDLEARGHRLQSASDVNLLPHGYEERGDDVFAGLHGMFAAAIWDATRRRLLLGRDPVGKKPLFWAPVGAGGLAFASELPALRALLDRPTSLDLRALADYLQLGFVPHPETIDEGVHALPPGSRLTFQAGEAPAVVDFRPSEPEPASFGGSRADALAELDRRLSEAVRLRLRSDVPVGLFLSGGIDSGLVAAYAAAAGARDLLCFVVEVGDPHLNEAPAARATARALGLPIEPVPLEFAPLDAVKHVPLLYGQPFGDSSALPSYFVARAARRHRKVVLNGDGGDETFAGYRRYWMARAAPWLVPLTRPVAPALGALGQRLAADGERRAASGFAARALRGLAASPGDRYLVWSVDLLDDATLARCFPDLAAYGPVAARLAALRPGLSCGSLHASQRSDRRLILADDLVVKMDIATMANSVEARSPFLDVGLLELAASLPARWLLAGRETKPLLRALARRHLPPGIARAPKRGFEVPVREWLAGPLRPMLDDVLLAPDSRVAALGHGPAIRAFVNGQDGFVGNRPQAVWCLLVLELFLRQGR